MAFKIFDYYEKEFKEANDSQVVYNKLKLFINKNIIPNLENLSKSHRFSNNPIYKFLFLRNIKSTAESVNDLYKQKNLDEINEIKSLVEWFTKNINSFKIVN